MNKHEYLLRFHRFQRSRENFFAPKIAPLLIAQYQTVIDNIEQADIVINQINHVQVEKVIRSLYMDAGIVYGAKVRSDLYRDVTRSKLKHRKFPYSIEEKARMPMGFSERMAQLIAEYFRTDILNTSLGITNTTKDLIRKVFSDAYEIGLSLDEIVTQLKDTELSRIRSRLIARTESVTASNKGAMMVAKDTGLELNKEWISAKDNRTRPHHRAENGQIIPMDQFFTVGPDLMLHPGDHGGHDGQPKVSAGNLCNCRCVAAYIPID